MSLCLLRIPFRNLVVGLLSHQVLVQTVGSLLLRGTSNLVPAERSMMAISPSASRKPSTSLQSAAEEGANLLHDSPMPGRIDAL